MMDHPVLIAMRATLAATKNEKKLADEFAARIHQLISGMVDGRVLATSDAESLKASLYNFVRAEALPTLLKRDPDYALRLLMRVAAFAPYTKITLAEEMPTLTAALEAKHPPPKPPTWPAIERLRMLAKKNPRICILQPPVRSSAFVKRVEEEGGSLPDDIISLYGAFSAFDLNAASFPNAVIPVFVLPGPFSLDPQERDEGYPRREAIFQGGDEVELCVYRDRKKTWWCTYEHEYQPVGKVLLDVPSLLEFGLRRATATNPDALNAELSWETYFKIS